MIRDLFKDDVRDVQLAPGAMLLGWFVLAHQPDIPTSGLIQPTD